MTENLPYVIILLYVTVKRKIQILLLQIRGVGFTAFGRRFTLPEQARVDPVWCKVIFLYLLNV